MLKPVSAASAPPRSMSAEPVTGSDPQAPAGFGEALEAAQQAAQQAAPQPPRQRSGVTPGRWHADSAAQRSLVEGDAQPGHADSDA